MARSNVLPLPQRRPAMATRWRRRAICTIIGGSPVPATLLSVSARAAIVEADGLAFGTHVRLCHPVAGVIAARVGARTAEGLRLHLTADAEAAGFAMSAIAADMTGPA